MMPTQGGEGGGGSAAPARTWPIAALLLVVLTAAVAVTAIAIVSVSYEAVGRAIDRHAGDVMAGAAAQVRERVRGMLLEGESVVRAARGLLEAGTLPRNDPAALERYFLEHMRDHPDFAAFYYGRSDGAFVFARRESRALDSGFVTRDINVAGGTRTVLLRLRDADLRAREDHATLSDSFDPRERPWFRAAVTRPDLQWTLPYIFYTSGAPGVSAALAVRDETGAVAGVVAVDLDLSDLVTFLDRLRFSPTSASMIVAGDGTLIAGRRWSGGDPDAADAAEAVISAPQLADLASAVLRAAALATAEAGGGSAGPMRLASIAIGDAGFFAASAPLAISGADWRLVSVARQSDFTAWFADAARASLLAAALVGLLVIAAGAWLVRAITAPLRVIRASTTAVAEGRYGDIAPPRSRVAELNLSERALFTMAGALRRRASENEVLNAHLVQLSEAVQQSPVGLALVTVAGQLDFANPALRAMLGREGDAVVGTALADLAADAAASAGVTAALDACRAGGVHRGEVMLRRQDGASLATSLLLAPVVAPDGTHAAYVAVIEDISERKANERRLVSVMETAVRANQAKAEFLANMSHELRTPLNAIIGFAQTINAQIFGPVGNERYAGYLRDIESSGQLLLTIVGDILDMARLDSGAMTLAEAEVEPAVVLHAARVMLSALAESQGIAIVEQPVDLPPVRADPGKLQQILVNLLSNAVKFTPRGGRVTIGAARNADGEPTFTVSDTGIGMTPEEIALALRPFERVRGNALVRDAGGIGLGLPISQALVALHGGRLMIDSNPGRGTTVRVVLPRARLVQQAAVALVRAVEA